MLRSVIESFLLSATVFVGTNTQVWTLCTIFNTPIPHTVFHSLPLPTHQLLPHSTPPLLFYLFQDMVQYVNDTRVEYM